MPQVIDELVTILGFDMDSRAGTVLDKFNKGVASVAQHAKKASVAVVAASTAVSYFVVQLNKASDEVEKLGRVTGISTDTIQEMTFAMEQVGGNAATMQSDLVSLMSSMNSPIPGEFNQGLFLLGISTKKASGELKNVDEVLLDIADKMQGMSKQKQMQWGNKIGISKDTIMLLQEGRGEIERLRKQAQQIPVIIDPENLKNAREFNRQISLIGRVIGFLGQTIASAAGPAVKDIVSGLMEWIKVNRKLIQSGLKAFINGIVEGFAKFADGIRLVRSFFGELIKGAGKVIPGFDKFVTVLGDVSEAITATEAVSVVVFSALTALAIPLVFLTAQFLVFASIIAAVGLIIDDFVGFLKGSESVTGELIKKVTELWGVFGDKFPAMADFLGELATAFVSFASFLKDVFFVVLDKFIDLLGLVGKGWGLILDLAEKGLGAIGFGDDDEIIEGKVQEITKTVKTEIIPGVKQIVAPMQEPVESMLGSVRDSIFGKIHDFFGDSQGSEQNIQAKIKEPLKKIQEPIVKIQEKIKEPVIQAQEKIKAPIAQIQEKIKVPMAQVVKAQEKIQKPIIKIQENLKGPITKVQERLQEPITKIQEKSREPVAQIQEKLQKPMAILQENIQVPNIQVIMNMVSKITDKVMSEVKELNMNGSISKTIEAVSAPISPISTNNNSTSEQNIVNNVDITVTGNNAPAVASEVSSKLKTTLQRIYPGGLAPAIQ